MEYGFGNEMARSHHEAQLAVFVAQNETQVNISFQEKLMSIVRDALMLPRPSRLDARVLPDNLKTA